MSRRPSPRLSSGLVAALMSVFGNAESGNASPGGMMVLDVVTKFTRAGVQGVVQQGIVAWHSEKVTIPAVIALAYQVDTVVGRTPSSDALVAFYCASEASRFWRTRARPACLSRLADRLIAEPT